MHACGSDHLTLIEVLHNEVYGVAATFTPLTVMEIAALRRRRRCRRRRCRRCRSFHRSPPPPPGATSTPPESRGSGNAPPVRFPLSLSLARFVSQSVVCETARCADGRACVTAAVAAAASASLRPTAERREKENKCFLRRATIINSRHFVGAEELARQFVLVEVNSSHLPHR